MQAQSNQLLESIITFEVFSNAALDSLYWYDRLPGDGVSVCEIPDSRSVDQLRDELLSAKELNLAEIDLLAARLLGRSVPLANHLRWKELAQRLSRAMSEQLTASGNRALRMRVQRLNYYIEALIIDSLSDQRLVTSECTLQAEKPWDYVEHLSAKWWVSSGSPNIYRDDGALLEQWTLGLPTQLDPLPDRRIAAGSIYSNGAYIHDGYKWQVLAHDAPVPLVFEYDSELFFLDHLGQLWRNNPRQPIGSVPCRQVHFARHFNDVVYCLDNSDYGHITTFNMAHKSCKRYSVQPVQVCNDLVVSAQYCYLIDKQQGSVFKFDLNFQFLERRLQFGRKETQLLDPVSIRMAENHLQVVSWLSQKLTQLRIF